MVVLCITVVLNLGMWLDAWIFRKLVLAKSWSQDYSMNLDRSRAPVSELKVSAHARVHAQHTLCCGDKMAKALLQDFHGTSLPDRPRNDRPHAPPQKPRKRRYFNNRDLQAASTHNGLARTRARIRGHHSNEALSSLVERLHHEAVASSFVTRQVPPLVFSATIRIYGSRIMGRGLWVKDYGSITLRQARTLGGKENSRALDVQYHE